MKKSLLIVLALIVTLGLFAGCGQQTQEQGAASTTSAAAVSSTAAQSTVAESTSAKTQYPLTLKDASGTTVTIKAKPAKMVIMPLGACEMLLSLVDKSTIAAMTDFVDEKSVSNVTDIAQGVGQRLSQFNAEKIIAIQPDLVIVDTWADAAIIKQLRDSGITVFVTSAPLNVDQEKEELKLLGNITDEAAKAEETIKWMEDKLKAVSDKLSKLKEEQKLVILDYSEMGSTSGKDTNFDDVVTRAGLINPVSKEGVSGWPNLSKEMIVKYNPDIISLPSWYYDAKVSFESLSNSIKGDKALTGVKAVKNNKLISVPYNHLSTTSQYSVLAVEDMAKAAYPELFK